MARTERDCLRQLLLCKVGLLMSEGIEMLDQIAALLPHIR